MSAYSLVIMLAVVPKLAGQIKAFVMSGRLGSPILSAEKVLNFVAAMMSILGLQTAMISRVADNGENYRKMMNTITGGFVFGIVILIAVYMLFHSKDLILLFYIRRMMGIITEWLKNDCADSEEHMIAVIQQCVIIIRRKHESRRDCCTLPCFAPL